MASATTTDPGQLSGLFKEVYGDSLVNLIPDASKITKMIPFVSSEKQEGDKYHQPVIVTNEHGVTYAAAEAGAFALNAAIPMTTKDAYIQGGQILLRSAMSYDAAAKASKSTKAFKKATQLLVENMMESGTKRLEIALLYGQSGLAYNDYDGSQLVTTPTATSVVFAVTDGHWASGIWAGMEGAQLNMYYNNAGTLTLVSSGDDSIFTVSAVDEANHTVTLTGTATGVTAVDTAIASYDTYLFFYGAKTTEMYGLKSIITNTGTLFGISAASYGLWAGNSITETGQLTMGKVLKGVGKCVQRGLQSDCTVLVNPDTWQNLASDIAALRRYDGSYSKAKAVVGAEALEYHGQNGKISIESYNVVKTGDCFILPTKKIKRVGAQDLSFKTPGREGEIFLHLASYAGYEMRLYTDQAIFIETPAQAGIISGFTNV